MTVQNVLDCLEKIAPFSLAEEWDNVGLLAGRRDASVEKVLCALDFTQAVLDEAIEKRAQMIVTHHPILFRGRKNLCEDDGEGRLLCNLIRSGIALAAMHTNFDNAHPGVNDVLAQHLGLQEIVPAMQGMCVGTVEAVSFEGFRNHVAKVLGGSVRAYGSATREIRRVAVLGGAGGDFTSLAQAAGADVYVTGEIGYHKALTAVDDGLCVLECGHAATENPAISMLCRGLQNVVNDVQYKVNVFCSEKELFL